MTTDTAAAPPPRLAARDAARLVALAEILDVLIRLHDREVDAGFLQGLAAHDIPGWIAGTLTGPEAGAGTEALRSALDLHPWLSDAALADLAVEYADLYLTHGYRVSPHGSVWLTEDRLERQDPMFEVRDWYAHYDIAVPDWRIRSDDHLVHELQFVSLLARGGTRVSAQDLARFMDLHVLSWMPAFCRKATTRLREPLYAAAMLLTEATLEALRETLEAITGTDRQVQAPALTPAERGEKPDATLYVPGAAPSW